MVGLYGRSPPARAKSENGLLPTGFGIISVIDFVIDFVIVMV